MRRSLIVDTRASSCYFRTSAGGDGRKALVRSTFHLWRTHAFSAT